MMGHSNVEVTLKKYNAFIPNLTRTNGSALEKAHQNHHFSDRMVIHNYN